MSEQVNESAQRSKQRGTSERVSGASKQANGRASGPVVQSVFLVVLDHSAVGNIKEMISSDASDVSLV